MSPPTVTDPTSCTEAVLALLSRIQEPLEAAHRETANAVDLMRCAPDSEFTGVFFNLRVCRNQLQHELKRLRELKQELEAATNPSAEQPPPAGD